MNGTQPPGPGQHVTIVADAEDKLITFNRVVSLLRARQFATVSVGAAQTQEPGVVRMTIVIDSERTKPGRVVACLSKLADVWNVSECSLDASLCRELALIKVTVPPGAAGPVLELAQHDSVRLLHRDDRALVLEVAAAPEEVDRLLHRLHLLESVEVVELVRASRLTMTAGLPESASGTFDETLARSSPPV